MRQSPHLHGPLDDFTLSFELDLRITTSHRHNADIGIGGQATVEADLLLAAVAALRQVRESDEPIDDWPLDFVDMVAAQEND
jgi:hypothetical protein